MIMTSQINPTSFLSSYEDRFPLPWMMSTAEKHCFIGLLNTIKPDAAIEIGNASGGSLQALQELVPVVFAIDIDPEVHRALQPKFPTVSFVTGNSTEIIPDLLKKMQYEKIKTCFILVDGDHSAEGVKGDIDSLLKYYSPTGRLIILCHDSFNPECRKGILSAAWADCPYVHQVDVDYISGTYVNDIYKGKIQRNTMWGGFCLAILEPFSRKEPLTIQQSGIEIYKQAFRGSFYNTLRYKAHQLLNKLK